MKRPNARTKCRRAGCGHTGGGHNDGPCTGLVQIDGTWGKCACAGFIDPSDIAKPVRKPPNDSEKAYREAYESGIREAFPAQAFMLTGAKIGSLVGAAAAQHAKGIVGADLLAWIRQKAREFRIATSDRPEMWGGWQPFGWVRWLNMGMPASRPGPRAGRPSQLQPMPAGGLRVVSIGLKDVK